MMDRQVGTVKRWISERGFGFIEVDDSHGPKVFCHWSAIQMNGYKELTPGARVEFGVEQSEKGACATDVVVLDDEPAADADQCAT